MDHYGEVPEGVFGLAKVNFSEELEQLRLFVRFGGMDAMMEADGGVEKQDDRQPPSGNLLQKVIQQTGTSVTSTLGRFDLFLEENKVLPELQRPPKKSAFMTQEWQEVRSKLKKLDLDNDAVVKMEKKRVAKEGEIESPLWVKAPFLALCFVLDILYDHKPIQKFWVLETVARIPYFAYISILHLYESLGFWRAGAELRKIHFAEEWNEMHHLQIMESLGGDQSWFDRFVADHSAVAYYWLLILFYLISPKLAYNFMQRVELHAMDTYAVFVEANEEVLMSIPPPKVALNYYLNEDLYLFDEFQTSTSPRRPSCANLYDVFRNIRDDELEHVKTMDACQNGKIALELAKKK